MAENKKTDISSIVTPSFESLVSSIYSAVLLNLGEIKVRGVDPISQNFEIAEFNIGLLEMLEEKTRGNLTEPERSYLEGVIRNSKAKLSEHRGKASSN